MSQREIVHGVLDGARVRLGGDDVDLSRHASSFLTLIVDGFAREFAASHVRFGRDVAADLGLSFEEEYGVQDGTLRLASGIQIFDGVEGRPESVPLHLGAWEGSNFSVHTHLYWGSRRDLLGIFSQVQIVEGDFGLELRPKGSAAFARYPGATMLKEIPSVGLLQMRELTGVAARGLPKWRGTRVAGGELFVNGDPSEASSDCSKTSFFLVGSTAITFVAPAARPPRGVLERLGKLEVGWAPRG